jgi:hypothetical protein
VHVSLAKCIIITLILSVASMPFDERRKNSPKLASSLRWLATCNALVPFLLEHAVYTVTPAAVRKSVLGSKYKMLQCRRSR